MFQGLVFLVFSCTEEQELLSLPPSHVRNRTIGGIVLCHGILPWTMFTMGFDDIQTESFDGHVEFLAHCLESFILAKPQADTLVTVAAHSHCYLSL